MAARPPGQATRSSVRVLSFKRVSLIKCVLRPAGTDDRVLSAPPFVKILRVPEHLFLQRKDARTEGVRLHRIIRLAVDLHTAVHRVDQAQQLRLGAHGAHGRAEVRQVYRITGVGLVAGCYVLDGKMQRNAQMRLLRDNIVIYDGAIASLQRFKDSVKEVAAGYECGITFEKFQDIKEGDIIEAFIMEQIQV